MKWLNEPGNIYIGRKKNHIPASKWGNPYIMGMNNGRTKVINLYEDYLQGNAELLERVSELKGKNLGCWCAPLPCHGEILHLLAGNRPVYQMRAYYI